MYSEFIIGFIGYHLPIKPITQKYQNNRRVSPFTYPTRLDLVQTDIFKVEANIKRFPPTTNTGFAIGVTM